LVRYINELFLAYRGVRGTATRAGHRVVKISDTGTKPSAIPDGGTIPKAVKNQRVAGESVRHGDVKAGDAALKRP
jgi:hypothetical protein